MTFPEVARQIDLFTGVFVDTRTPPKKRRDVKRGNVRQAELFSQRELAQFGVRARPLLPITPRTRLELAMQDPRTAEEKERDLQHEAEAQTYQLSGAVASSSAGLTSGEAIAYANDMSHEAPRTPRRPLLLDNDAREQMPALYSNESKGLAALALVKFFTPDSNWTWYASEGSPVDADGYYDTDQPKVDYLLFGLVAGHDVELGYFSLAELEQARGPLGLPIERDVHFRPTPLSELMALHGRERDS